MAWCTQAKKNRLQEAVFYGYSLRPGPGSTNRIGNIKLLEVVDKLGSQFFGSRVIGILVSPGVARIQQAVVNTGNVFWHVQVDDFHVLGFGVGNAAILDGSNDAMGGRDVETLANTVTTASPAGVDQVHPGTKRVDALDQQLGIDTSRTREERCAKAGGESGLDTA